MSRPTAIIFRQSSSKAILGTEQLRYCNELADGLARLASTTPFIGPEPCKPVSTTVLQKLISEWKGSFYKYWRLQFPSSHLKKCITINMENSKFAISLNRNNLRRLTNIST